MRGAEADATNAGDIISTSPAFHITFLGAGGGPNEDNVMGLLVKSSATKWTKGSVLAVDAGTHLAGIIRILEEHLPTTNFRETSQPDSTNPIVLSSGPFANLELPCQSAGANGAYMIRDLIATYLITHSHLDHISGLIINTAALNDPKNPKRVAALPSTIDAMKDHIFNDIIWPNLSDENGGAGLVTFMRLEESEKTPLEDKGRRTYVELCDGLSVNCWSVSHGQCRKRHTQNGIDAGARETITSNPLTRRASRFASSSKKAEQPHPNDYVDHGEKFRAYNSAAYFLRDHFTGKEALIFGDVEPDSLSLWPRTARVWKEAATKVVRGTLAGILIECSFPNSQVDERLYGHLNPHHLMIELHVLASSVRSLQLPEDMPDRTKRRKRTGDQYGLPSASGIGPVLAGLRIIITHVKNTLEDGLAVEDTILAQLRDLEKKAQLGVVFAMSKAGTSIWL